ncbi:hypothetical protein AX14_006660 [Amanita brunnescens Koide BX004]|nr:hypothetical protein AX14_006660 [Amanita brunnescens Koide BX004]
MTTIEYLTSLEAVRERCNKVFGLAKENKLQYFNYNEEREVSVAEFCITLLKRDYGTDFTKIQPHSRWRHLDAGTPRVEPLLQGWIDIDLKEKARRIIDLTLVSVILDAGAGNVWKYTEASSGNVFSRSEGLAVASVHLFKDGFFSSNSDNFYQVDAKGLSQLSASKLEEGMQADENTNPIVGIAGRAGLLYNLGTCLNNTQYFGEAPGRPGNMIDFLESKSSVSEDGTTVVPFTALWNLLINGLGHMWPSHTKLSEVSLGDVWPCPALKEATGSQGEGDDFVPFHKLSQWLAYSLIEVLERTLNWRIVGKEKLTGLPEYRNGISAP